MDAGGPAAFQGGQQQLVEQYNAYEALPGLHVNGEQTLGENIADVAGLAAAYDAYKMSLHGKPLPVVDGLTGDQRFFLAFAQSWRHKTRDAAFVSRSWSTVTPPPASAPRPCATSIPGTTLTG